ncbi:hypothetical protein Pcinc_006272 [Petrolisthes cinctipes]|uniref:C-type lectin domain-containing protein n=1 Tax=Petrolisthes cinctipes TaxID=88211 RepID=A0AAE1GD37_PETCI|nr:hypothetical protein Pcinc_006272 [Petrolisthes cinctipes]
MGKERVVGKVDGMVWEGNGTVYKPRGASEVFTTHMTTASSTMTPIALVFLLLATYTSAQGCGTGWNEVGSECYYFSNTESMSVSWDMARTNCDMKGGDLAIMQQDCAQDQHLVDYIISQGWHLSWFVGVTDEVQDDLWVWIDGRVADLQDSLWREGEPGIGSSSDCGFLDYYNYDFPRVHLIDGSCYNSYYYICQFGVHSKVNKTHANGEHNNNSLRNLD